MIQGMGGIMDLTGAPDGEPQKIGVAFADIFTGVYSAVGVLAALLRRERQGMGGGAGGHLDMALLDTQVSVLANQALNYLVSGHAPTRMGNGPPQHRAPTSPSPSPTATSSWRWGNDGQYRRFCAAIGDAALGEDPALSHQPRPGGESHRARRPAVRPHRAHDPRRAARRLRGAPACRPARSTPSPTCSPTRR